MVNADNGIGSLLACMRVCPSSQAAGGASGSRQIIGE